jgi:hypothetical protein
MIPALRLVPSGHTLVTLGERFFGGLTLYYDRAPRGAPYIPHGNGEVLVFSNAMNVKHIMALESDG